MIRKPIRIVAGILTAAIALAAIAAGAVAWRLYLGPVEAGFAARHLRAELARALPDLTIGLGGTEVLWPGEGSGLPLRGRDLRLIGKDGGELAHFPEVVMSIAPLPLLAGELRLESIRFLRPEIALERDGQGNIALRSDVVQPGGQDRILAVLFDRLSGKPADGDALGILGSVEIVDGAVTLTDRATGRVWRGDSLRSALRRRPDGLAGELSFALGNGSGDGQENGKSPARIGGAAVYLEDTGRISGTVTFDGLNPAVLAGVSNGLGVLEQLRAPLSGKVTFAASDDGRLLNGAVDAAGGAGTLRLPGVYRGPLRIRSLRLAGAVEEGARTAKISRFQADLGDTKLDLTGFAQRAGEGFAVEGEGSAAGFGVGALRRLWPGLVAPGARKWVIGHVGAGRVNRVQARFRLVTGGKGPVRVQRLAGSFGFEGLNVRLPGTLPALNGVGGEARFDLAGIDFRGLKGRLGQTALSGGSVRIGGPGGPGGERAKVAIDATADGTVQAFLGLIDRKALESMAGPAADTAAIRGRVRVRVKSDFPLADPPSLDKVPFTAEAQLSDIAWPGAVFGLDLAGGSFGLTAGGAGFRLDGECTVAGAAAKLVWEEKFGAVSKSWRRQLSIKGVTTAKALHAEGLDVRSFLSGPFGVEVTLRAYDDGRQIFDGAYDFRRARLAVPVLDIVKPAKQPARGSSRLVFRNGRLAEIARLSLQSKPIAFQGRATMERDGRTLRRLTLSRLTAGRTQLAATLERRVRSELGSVGRRLRLTGRALDLAPLLETRPNDSKRAGAERPLGAPLVEPLDMEFRFDRLFLSISPPLRSASGSARFDGTELPKVRLTAALPSGKTLNFRLTPDGDGQTVRLISDDGGGALRALGIVDNLRGGSLSVRARRRPSLEGKPMSGILRLKNFGVEGAPAIARFFSIAERRRIGGNVRMQRLGMKFDLRGDRLAISEGSVYSSLIGVTAAGEVGRTNRQVRLRGTLVPLYELNSVFGKVPIIGDLLIGEKGSGLLAANFSVSGTVDKPKFQVNPISLLTPGAIRRIFDFSGGGRSGDSGGADEKRDDGSGNRAPESLR